MRLLLLSVKHTYDTPLEVSQAFGSAIKDTLTTLEPVGKFPAVTSFNCNGHVHMEAVKEGIREAVTIKGPFSAANGKLWVNTGLI